MCRHHFAEDCDCVDGYRKQLAESLIAKDQTLTPREIRRAQEIWGEIMDKEQPTQLPKRPIIHEACTLPKHDCVYWKLQADGLFDSLESQLKTVLDREAASTARYDAKIAELENQLQAERISWVEQKNRGDLLEKELRVIKSALILECLATGNTADECIEAARKEQG